MNPNLTFIFDYISRYHMNGRLLSEFCVGFKTEMSKKYFGNTSVSYKIPSNTPN